MPEYAYNQKTQLSDHFNSAEFRCKCGRQHSTLINPNLVKKLEELHSALRCSKIIISSGYRCKDHDKAVGGTGYGKHTEGTAADFICYDKSGSVINSKKVACAAQDIGFGGIANIKKTYDYIHCDVRTDYFWKGDEAVPGGTNNSVTNDFYNYYGLTKADVYGEETEKPTSAAVKEVTAEVIIDGKKYSGRLTLSE